MKIAYGFKEENVKPYNFNAAPFIADKNSIQQGYLTAEPFAVEKEAASSPTSSCSPTRAIRPTRRRSRRAPTWSAKYPDLVQRFVDASAIGWYHYLYGDNSKANAAIKKDNPDMTDEQIAFSIAKMKEYGLVDSGDTLKLGIGAMTDARDQGLLRQMVKAGVVKPDLDYKKAYTLQFVDKGVGLDLRPK